MAHPYLPHTDADIRAMLDRIGVKTLDDLYSDVPEGCRKKGAYALPDALSEQEIRDCFAALDAMNPEFYELIPLTLEEIFINEMEEHGYEANALKE